jgi:tetratricopeptide (TPR) repeat protein
MHGRTLGVLALTGAVLLSLPVPRLGAGRPAALNLPALLDVYASGRFDDALAVVERASDKDGLAMRLLWPTAGRQWIDTDPAHHRRRLLVAAAFALEVEHVRVERGQWFVGPWQKTKNGGGFTCSGRCVLDWAVRCLVERGAPDEAEHAWWLAAIALAQGVRDGRFLDSTYQPPSSFAGTFGPFVTLPPQPGILPTALERYPADPQFRLAQAMAQAAQFDVTTDAGPRSPATNVTIAAQGSTTTTSQGESRSGMTIRSRGQPTNAAASVGPNIVRTNRARYAARDLVIAHLNALTSDPLVGVEARVRLGYLYWATGDDEPARAELATAARTATDRDQRYLANFLLGLAAQSAQDETAAVDAFTAALEARPHAQSAALALAALDLRRGQSGRAYDRAQRAIDAGNGGTDPWRQFLYGHYPQWPALRDALRRAVSK